MIGFSFVQTLLREGAITLWFSKFAIQKKGILPGPAAICLTPCFISR
jgi:hypothetical protein